MGEGALAGMPLQLAGTRKILEFMDWGDYGAKDTFIQIGSIGILDSGLASNMTLLSSICLCDCSCAFVYILTLFCSTISKHFFLGTITNELQMVIHVCLTYLKVIFLPTTT